MRIAKKALFEWVQFYARARTQTNENLPFRERARPPRLRQPYRHVFLFRPCYHGSLPRALFFADLQPASAENAERKKQQKKITVPLDKGERAREALLRKAQREGSQLSPLIRGERARKRRRRAAGRESSPRSRRIPSALPSHPYPFLPILNHPVKPYLSLRPPRLRVRFPLPPSRRSPRKILLQNLCGLCFLAGLNAGENDLTRLRNSRRDAERRREFSRKSLRKNPQKKSSPPLRSLRETPFPRPSLTFPFHP